MDLVSGKIAKEYLNFCTIFRNRQLGDKIRDIRRRMLVQPLNDCLGDALGIDGSEVSFVDLHGNNSSATFRMVGMVLDSRQTQFCNEIDVTFWNESLQWLDVFHDESNLLALAFCSRVAIKTHSIFDVVFTDTTSDHEPVDSLGAFRILYRCRL